LLISDRGGRNTWSTYSKNGTKTADINVKNFHRSLTTVVRAQNDTSKTANITDTIFNITSSSAVAERPHDALCLSVVSLNKIITRADSFIIVT